MPSTATEPFASSALPRGSPAGRQPARRRRPDHALVAVARRSSASSRVSRAARPGAQPHRRRREPLRRRHVRDVLQPAAQPAGAASDRARRRPRPADGATRSRRSCATGWRRPSCSARRCGAIVGTARTFPVADGFDAERLRATLSFRAPRQALDARAWRGAAGRAGRAAAAAGGAGRAGRASRSRRRCPTTTRTCPSEVGGHQVIRRTPVEAWDELVARVAALRPPGGRQGRRGSSCSTPRS